MCDLWGVWADTCGATHLCKIVCETCCGAAEGVSCCHQVLPRLWRMESDFSKGPFPFGPQSEVLHWCSLFPMPMGAPFSLPALTLLVPGDTAALSCSLMSLSVVLQPAAEGDTSNPCPRGSGRPKSSLGLCGQHLIPAEWFSTLRPAREGNRQLNLPTACSTSWLQPAGDSFPQGGCQQLSWGTLRLSVQAV